MQAAPAHIRNAHRQVFATQLNPYAGSCKTVGFPCGFGAGALAVAMPPCANKDEVVLWAEGVGSVWAWTVSVCWGALP